MRAEIGKWDRFWIWRCGWGASGTCYVEDGVFKMDTELARDGLSYEDRMAFKRSLGKALLGDEEFFFHVADEFLRDVVFACKGKPLAEAQEVAGQYAARRRERQEKYAAEQKRWDDLRKEFGGVVIGLDKAVDVFETGFSVRVVLKSDVSFADRKRFLVENRKRFVRWVMHEVSENRRAMQKIGDIRFYKPVEMVALRAPEVEIKFEVKEMEGIA